MEEIFWMNLPVAVLAFFLLYFPFKKLCYGYWDYTKVMLSVMTIYYIFYFGSVMGFMMQVPSTHLWYPYNFGGMPAYAIGFVGVKWWNHVQVIFESSIHIFFVNPIFMGLFYLSLFFLIKRWIFGKKIIWNFAIVIVAEIVMIFMTSWE